MHAFLLDMYSDRRLADTGYSAGQDFLDACPFFELGNRTLRPDGYWEGGVRRRVFDTQHLLSKHPLVKRVPGLSVLGGTHFVIGAQISQLRGATLHFKFFQDFAEQARIATTAQKWWGRRNYELYFEEVERNPNLNLHCEESVRFEGSHQLIEHGIMESAAWHDELCRRVPMDHALHQESGTEG